MLQLKQTLAAVAAVVALSGAAYAQDNEPAFTPEEQGVIDTFNAVSACVVDRMDGASFSEAFLEESITACFEGTGTSEEALDNQIDDMINKYGGSRVYNSFTF